MLVSEAMTKPAKCCQPTTSLQDVAKLMVEGNCGEIPVASENGEAIGVVTDRDIVCRTLAQGKDPMNLTAEDCMSSNVVTVNQESTIEVAIATMESNMVRRLPVVDGEGKCVGMITQGDIARLAPENEVAELLHQVSQPISSPSAIH